mgnify:CR=1 FL=1
MTAELHYTPRFEFSITQDKFHRFLLTIPEVVRSYPAIMWRANVIPADHLTSKTRTLSGNRVHSVIEKINTTNSISFLEQPSDMSRGSSSGADSVLTVKKLSDGRYKTKQGLVVDLESERLRVPL